MASSCSLRRTLWAGRCFLSRGRDFPFLALALWPALPGCGPPSVAAFPLFRPGGGVRQSFGDGRLQRLLAFAAQRLHLIRGQRGPPSGRFRDELAPPGAGQQSAGGVAGRGEEMSA